MGAVLVWRKAWSWRGLRAVRRRFPARIDRYAHAGRARIRAACSPIPKWRWRWPHTWPRRARRSRARGPASNDTWTRSFPPSTCSPTTGSATAWARLLLPLLYKVSVGHEPRAALNAIPRESVVIYLMNHRSNADYVLVAYVLSGRVAVSYAVGEWARVWPLETLFKSFGSYFVRRR